MSEAVDVRTEAFTTDGPVQIDVQLSAGSLEVELTEDADTVQVDLHHDESAQQPWAQGLASALNWVNEQFGDQFDTDLVGTAAAVLEQTRVELTGSRLVVRAPQALPLRHLPLGVTVRAPKGSQLDVRAASARVNVTGTAATVNVTTTSGDVTLGGVDGPLHLRTGGGDVNVASVKTSVVVTGTGSVRVGSVDGELSVRSGSGDVTVADATAGAVNVKSGSGDVRIGLHSGVLAELHLSSATGRARSELDVSHEPPEEVAPLRVKARSGSGNVTVSAAAE